jgi:polysaccharide biosynthesis protein PelC
MKRIISTVILSVIYAVVIGCATTADVYRDANMDFGAIRTVAVLPFANLSRDNQSADRVRDVFSNMLMATGTIYVVPAGEVVRGISRVGIGNPAAPSPEEITKLAGIIKVDAVITGVVKEYGEVRSGSSGANVISLSLQVIEAQTGKIVWTASSTKGGIGMTERLLGGGGEPMNKITEQAVNDLIDKLFK